jgi:hypothetical protein
MLYDPKWEAPAHTRNDPLKIGTLIEWLQNRNPQEPYCFLDSGHCLFAQYFSAHGFTNIDMGGWTIHHGMPRQKTPLPEYWDDIACNFPRTFGAALQRARKLAAGG